MAERVSGERLLPAILDSALTAIIVAGIAPFIADLSLLRTTAPLEITESWLTSATTTTWVSWSLARCSRSSGSGRWG